MGFLAPLWLGALAAIALPIVLHLRAAAPPERVQVGSIADLTPGIATASRPRLRELLLLALRILFVTLLALLLAHPVLRDRRAGRTVGVVPAGADRLRDSLRAAGVAIADVQPSLRQPWQMSWQADRQLGVHDTILLVTPDGADRYSRERVTLTHTVRILPANDPPAPAMIPLRVRIVASSAELEPQRDSVERLLGRVPASVLTIATGAVSDARVVTVGRDTALGLDAASLRRGALNREGAVDSLLTRLLPPADPVPPLSQRAPRHVSAERPAGPSRDLRALCWWLLLALFLVERVVASRRT